MQSACAKTAPSSRAMAQNPSFPNDYQPVAAMPSKGPGSARLISASGPGRLMAAFKSERRKVPQRRCKLPWPDRRIPPDSARQAEAQVLWMPDTPGIGRSTYQRKLSRRVSAINVDFARFPPSIWWPYFVASSFHYTLPLLAFLLNVVILSVIIHFCLPAYNQFTAKV